jgi:hypothetical protein
MTERESPFACDMTAIAPEQRGEHLATIDTLFSSVESIRELSNGYSFQFRNQANLLLTVAQFVALERLCCPFFGFDIEVESEGGALLLSLTGREGVKPFIIAEIGDHLPRHLRQSYNGLSAS